MSQQRSKPRFEVITLESDDDNDDHGEITVLEARGPNIGRAQARTNRSVPSQVEVIVIDDDDNTLSRVPRKTAKRPRNALGRFCASQNDPPAVVGETSTQSSNATQRKSARLQGQPPVRVALAASFRQSSTAEGKHTEDEEATEDTPRVLNPTSSRKSMRLQRGDEPMDVDRNVPIERNEAPSTSSSSATRPHASADTVSSNAGGQRRSLRLQKVEPMEVEHDNVDAVSAKKQSSVEGIVTDDITSTPSFSNRRQSARLREQALTLETLTEEQADRDASSVSTNTNVPALKSNSIAVKKELPDSYQHVDEANSVEKEAASTSTSSSSQKNTAQSEASSSSMAGSTLQRSMKKEDVEATPEPAITENILRGRVIRSIKTEPLEMDDSGEAVEQAQSVKTVPKSSSMLGRNSSAKKNAKPQSDPFFMPRAITVPLGVTRVPFHVKISEEQQQLIRDYRIQIEDHDNFPNGFELAARYFRTEEDSEDKDDNTAPRPSTAVLPDFIGPVTKQYTDDAKNDKEEPMWSESKLAASLRGNEQRLNQCYKKIQDDYLFCVWRQFEGRIPIEVALQHLMKNSFSIEKSLETIEKDCLRRVPQKLRDPSTAQAHQIHRILLNEDLGDYDYRNIQETILKNYHMFEVVNLFHRFTKFYGYADDGWKIVPGCNCSTGVHRDVCRNVDFQPRYACENCTKNYRKTKFQPIGLCLICSTYQKYANKVRPVRGVIFDDDDLDKMAEWDRMEIQLKRRVKLSDFNTRYQAKKDSEHRSLQITKEESLTLDFDRLKSSKSRPAELTRQLKPFILPHFSRCYCKDAGWIPVRSENFYKTTFTEEEIELYRTTILQNPKDIQAAANQLDVEKELVERFIRAYPHNDPVWMGQLEKELILKLRECRPFENLAPNIRSFKKDEKKRVRTPPIPLE
ncbi:hypothetical protein CAEBREN_06926 [Caenorhabditis brenneri]|uniref:ELM2 domain-containing protein n=1 Tax=Caenorhabditis brenneri TaxID=135651 RepID=G0M8H1_CAEBE|nr:hypothetical protein CAEBREN_06926 [Caenorhabditis brenneri]